MATEDIRVEHSKSAETATFDIKNRCLVLPIWKDMSNSMYDMLVAHEVSHALHTPFDQWKSALDNVSDKNVDAFKQICNVVEDARIERMIKQQYAGVRKDFARAYAELDNSDMFQIRGKNVADMNLIDRLNLHFKLGLFGLLQVPFSADEKSFVDRMENSKTFQDVLDIANDLYEDWNESLQEDENQQQSQDSGEQGDGQNDEQGSQGQSNDDTGEESQDGSQSGSESDEGDEDGENSGSSDSDDTASDASQSTDGAGDDASQSQQSATNQPNLDEVKGESDSDSDSNENSGDEQGEQGQSDYSYDSYSEGDGALPSETQSAMDSAISKYIDLDGDDNEYFTLPESMNLDNIILDYKTVASMFDKHSKELTKSHNSYYERHLTESNQATDTFLNGSKSVVNHMVNQFQMKQSADADRRTQISRSGVLDTTSMMNYRWSEDIFVKNESVSDGKNHGMVFFLDWSGSMSRILKDTVEQLLILTQFCQKTNIPFEVYAFSSNNILGYDDDGTRIDGFSQYTSKEGSNNPLRPHGFMLINFLSSRMNKAEYKTAVSRLYGCAGCASGHRGMTPQGLGLSCTPLNEAIVSALDIVPAFQEATGVQIVNTVFLTDGDGSSLGANSYGSKAVIHDPRTKKNFTVAKGHYRSETDTYLQILKDRTGCNLIGIRLHDNKNVHQLRYGYFNDNDMGDAVKGYTKSNFAEASDDKTGYDACYIIKGNIGTDEDALDSLGDDASYTQLRNAFRKNAGNAKTNKIIATKMIEVFASTLQK
jgi:cobalamin biosynthesis protein CobT